MILIEILKDNFDGMVILNLSSRKDRRELIERQLTELGIPQPGTDPFIRYNFTTPFKYNPLIANAFNQSKSGIFSKPNEYDCARNHYNIVRTCYDLGYENCLILEDDILFMKDAVKIINYIENIPEDYDVIQFGGFTVDPFWTYIKNENKTDLWLKHDKLGIWNCSMYALSRAGMEYYIAYMEKIFCVADYPVYAAGKTNYKLVNTYISREPVVIQANKDIMISDIRNKENDDINYETQNVYENDIDKNNYFSC